MEPLVRVTRPPVDGCRAIELIEARSALSQHQCAPVGEAKRLGLRTESMGAAAVVLTRKSQNLRYNRVIGLGQASAATEGQLGRLIGWAADQRVEAVGADVGAAARPGRLIGMLEAVGFERTGWTGKLWRDARPLPPATRLPAVSVRRVRPSQAARWVDVVGQVWRTFHYRRPWFEARVGTPGWIHYLAWMDEEPVGAAAMYVDQVRSVTVGHLVDGVTLAPWRRRGVQTALIRRRLSDGRARRCELFTSETAPPPPADAPRFVQEPPSPGLRAGLSPRVMAPLPVGSGSRHLASARSFNPRTIRRRLP